MHGQISPRDAARLKGYSLATQVAIAVSAISAILLLATFFWAYSIRKTGLAPDQSTTIGIGILGGVGMIGLVLPSLAGTATFLLWFHKAIANLHRAELSGLRARPLWSVISLFVPIAQLFIPFLAMRELWNRSHGEDEYQSRTAVTTISVWWLCLLTGSFLIAFVLVIASLYVFSPIKLVAPGLLNFMLLVVGIGFQCMAAGCLVVILRRITAAQASLIDGSAIFA